MARDSAIVESYVWANEPSSIKGQPVFPRNEGWPDIYQKDIDTEGGIAPSMSTFNQVFYDTTNFAYDVNRYGGNLLWDESITYEVGAIVVASNNKRYVALTQNINQEPSISLSDWYFIDAVIQFATPEMFGATASSTPSERTAFLLDALNSSFNTIYVTPGIYDPIEISQSSKTIHCLRGHLFKLPDNTTTAATTEPVPTVHITGSDIRFVGKLSADGNLSNNPSDSINTSRLIGVVHVAGDDINFENEVFIENASWIGFSVGSELDSGSNIFLDLLVVDNPYLYPTSFWQASNWQVNRINVTTGAGSVDAAIRTGTQTSSTFYCQDGAIGSIVTNDVVLLEARSLRVAIGDIVAQALKIEDNSYISVDSALIADSVGAEFSFALNGCDHTTVGQVIVNNNMADVSVGKVCSVNNVTACVIDTVVVSNTQSNITDFEIRSAQDLTINNIILRTPAGTGRGFLFDYDISYAPQNNIRIGNITSTGHVGLDVEVQSPQIVDILINNINNSATTNFPYYKNSARYSEGTFIPTLTPTGGTITLSGSQNTLAWTKTGRCVTVTGRVQVSAVAAATGDIVMSGLPFPAGDVPPTGTLDKLSAWSQFFISIRNVSGTFSGHFEGEIQTGSSVVTITLHDGNSSSSSAQRIQVNTTLVFNFSYFTN